jgi:hypothetical protein
MAKQCTACGGVYTPIGSDGVPYFHHCPPELRAAVLRGGQARLVPLTDLQATDEIVVLRAGVGVRTLVSLQQPTDARLGDSVAARPNARDENVVVSFDGEKRVGVIKAAGAGVVDVVVPPADPLDVFTRVK